MNLRSQNQTLYRSAQIILGFCLAFVSHVVVAADGRLGLAPSTNAIGRAEAVTAGANGNDALFYNPALLSRNTFSLRLLGIEGTRGLEEEKVPELKGEAPTLMDAFSLLKNTQSVHLSVTVRALELGVPYGGMGSFARVYADARESKTNPDSYDIYTRSDIGAIAGLALKIGKFSLGYSQYLMSRAEINAHPTTEQISTIAEAADAGVLDEQTLPFHEFTDMTYGGTRGHNAGLHYTFWDDNPTGLGISVLNIGGSTFNDRFPINQENVRRMESKIVDEAARNQIALGRPAKISQMANAGACIGWGEPGDVFEGLATADYQDITGDHLRRKFAASWQVGITVPDSASVASSIPLVDVAWLDPKKSKGSGPKATGHMLHMGLKSLKVFGGYREKSYITRGAGLGLHFGVDKKVSLLLLDIEGFELVPIKDSGVVPQAGMRAVASLVLMF